MRQGVFGAVRFCLAGLGRESGMQARKARWCVPRHGLALEGVAGMARGRMATVGPVVQGRLGPLGSAWEYRLGKAVMGRARLGRLGTARQAWFGTGRPIRHSTVRAGLAGKGRFGSGWQGIGGEAGTVRRFRRVPAREYPARHGRLGKARCVGTWMWWAWQSIVRQAGRAARGRQGTVMGGMAWRAGPLWCGQAADGTA